MRRLKRILIIAVILISAVVVWLWWNRPRKVDMSTYVPANSLVYVESNSMVDIATGIVSTNAWTTLKPATGSTISKEKIEWLSWLASWTGIGSAEAVALSRAQVAVVITGFDTFNDKGETLKVKPRLALVAETNTSQRRACAAAIKLVGDLIKRSYGDIRVEANEKDGIDFLSWKLPTDRRIVAAIIDGTIIVANDEPTLHECLSVRNGTRPSLTGNVQMQEMRKRLSPPDARAFGYISNAGATKLFETIAKEYFRQASPNPRAEGVIASLLPHFNKMLGDIGWSSRFVDGLVEDRYIVQLQNSVTAQMTGLAIPQIDPLLGASQLLPIGTYSLTHYNYNNPQAAWQGLQATIATQLDVLSALLISEILKAALKPYGIDDPVEFLSSIGPEIATAQLDNSGESSVLIVESRNGIALRRMVMKRLGVPVKTERIGNAEMIISEDDKRGAASFIDGRLIVGSANNVRRCLQAKSKNQTLANMEAFKRSSRLISSNERIDATTYTDDRDNALAFIKTINGPTHLDYSLQDDTSNPLNSLAYATTVTKITESGIERQTRSSFGLFSSLVTLINK
jgi:hypothetical protein